MTFAPLDEPPTGPVEIHPHRLKLRILAVLCSLASAWIIVQSRSAPEASPYLFLGLVLALGAAMSWRAASDPRPVLVIGPEGLEDRMHGFVPWRDVERFRAQRGLAPGFGWALKKGLQPPRNVHLYRLQAFLNTVSGLPARSYRRKLLMASPEQMAELCRAFRPDLER